jgi:hypothetical protein
VIGKRLTDELGDRVALIVDGVDGRTHHVVLGDKAVAADAPMGSIVEIGRAPMGPRASDRNIAAMAADTGVYRPSEHRAMAVGGHVRVPGGDFDGYIESHVCQSARKRDPLSASKKDPLLARRSDRWASQAQAGHLSTAAT